MRAPTQEDAMKRMIFGTLILLVSATWGTAQQSHPNQANESSASNQTTIQGCLSRSEGDYIVTDKSGTMYHLKGDTGQLADHVGHEVQIKGTMPDSSTASGASTSDKSEQNIEVASMNHISEKCSTKEKSEQTPMSEKPPMSENPPK
jgi:hypothetical protein